MSDLLEQLAQWMRAEEDEHLEFKEANNRFDFELLVKYCCAFANEGGGHIILGVSDQRPRHVVGSKAFADLQRTKLGLLERLRLRIDGWELEHLEGRVIVFAIPGRPIGVPLQYNGAYWMRGGESLVPMTPDQLKRIFDEAQPDFSAQVCGTATLDDLDPKAIQEFRQRWVMKAKRDELASFSNARLLQDAELLVGDGAGVYTRKRGLDRNTNKALLLKHIQSNAKDGCPLGELQEVLPALSRVQVQTLLREMKRHGSVHSVGRTGRALVSRPRRRWRDGVMTTKEHAINTQSTCVSHCNQTSLLRRELLQSRRQDAIQAAGLDPRGRVRVPERESL